MMTKFINKVILIIALLSTVIFGKNNTTLNLGLNYSHITNIENSESGYGYFFGISEEFNIIEKINVSIGLDILKKNVKIKNVTIRPYIPYSHNEEIESYYWDINSSMIFFDFPISLNYCFFNKNNFDMIVTIGSGFSWAFDKTELKQKEFYNMYDPNNVTYNFDYEFHQEYGTRSLDFALIYYFGLSSRYKNIIIEFDLLYDNRTEYGYYVNIGPVEMKINTVIISLGYLF